MVAQVEVPSGPGLTCHRKKFLKDARFAVNLNKKCKIGAQCDDCVEKNFWAVEKIFHCILLVVQKNFLSPLKRLKKIFHRYQQHAVNKNSPLPEDCGDIKFSMLPGRSPQFLQIFTAKFNAYHKFTGNIIEVSDRWRSGVKSCWQSCRRWKVRTRVRQFSFVRNPVKARKNIFSTKNHKTYKMSPHSTLKDAGGEKSFCFTVICR